MAMVVGMVIIYLAGATTAYGVAYGTQRATWSSMPTAKHRRIALLFASLSWVGVFGVVCSNVTSSVKWGFRL